MVFSSPLRFRLLYSNTLGTHAEVQFILSTFGILFYGEIFPIGRNGEHRLQRFLEIFKMWQQQEEDFLTAGVKEETTLIPGPKDVLLGRQKFVQEHCGNLRFRFTVETFREKYENNTTRLEKTEIASTIVRLVKESSGRFLKQDGSGWFEVDDVTAREKVSHTFRNKRDKAAAATNNNKSITATYKNKALPIQDKSRDKESLEREYMSITSRTNCDDHMDSKRLRSMPPTLFL
jgi:hypothetical protein